VASVASPADPSSPQANNPMTPNTNRLTGRPYLPSPWLRIWAGPPFKPCVRFSRTRLTEGLGLSDHRIYAASG
jgi:hypothetical protein